MRDQTRSASRIRGYAGIVAEETPSEGKPVLREVTPLREALFDRLPDADGPCPYDECTGDGWVVDDATRTAAPCRCRPQRLAAQRTKALTREIPERYRHISFESPEVEELATRAPAQVRAVRRYCEAVESQLDSGNGLGFHGDPGTGKTMLAYLISRAAMNAGKTVAVYSFPRLLAAIRDTYQDDFGDGYGAFLDRLIEVDLLQLDDLGAERPSDWASEQIFLLIDGRYEAKRSVVYTTNLPLPGGDSETASREESLSDRIGARVASRLSEISPPLPLFGTDQRTSLAPDLL